MSLDLQLSNHQWTTQKSWRIKKR